MVFFGNFLFTKKESYSCRSTKLPIPRPQAQRLFAAVRFPSRNRRFPDRCRSPDCASTAFRCRCLLLRQKLFVLPCRRLRNNYILCPTGTPTFAALRRQRRDLIIANPVEANTPTVAGQAVAEASAPVNAGTVLLTDSDDRCTPPASTHCQICTCCPRAKGPLDRRSKWFSLVTFF